MRSLQEFRILGKLIEYPNAGQPFGGVLGPLPQSRNQATRKARQVFLSRLSAYASIARPGMTGR